MQPGFRVGQFVLERPLGEGGMAEVWLARNPHIGTPAAVKFLNRQFASRKDIEARFLNEGRRQGALDHPNIVKVFGFEYVGAHGFLILQFIEGDPLDVRLQRGRMRNDEMLRVSTGILNALSYAHSKGVVHRDIKPSNILLDWRGQPFLGDFGLVLATNEERVTRTGVAMGTPHYMSPEQISRPMEVDHRADIYSFGCVLYELLTGRVPFDATTMPQGNSDFMVQLAHLQTPPPLPRTFNPEIRPALEKVVLKCLAKEPAQRFASCAEVLSALEHAITNPDADTSSNPRQRAQTIVETPAAPRGPGPASGSFGRPHPSGAPPAPPPRSNPSAPPVQPVEAGLPKGEFNAKNLGRVSAVLVIGAAMISGLVAVAGYAKRQGDSAPPPPPVTDYTIKTSPVDTSGGNTNKTAPPVNPTPKPREDKPAEENKPPATAGPMRVGGNVEATNLLTKVAPAYPPLAKAARVQGTVRFTAILAKDGTVKSLSLISGHPMLVQSAMDAVKQWVYKPTLLNGEPVEVITEIDVNYTLTTE